VSLNKKARWSDGKPVSADDLIFTWHTLVDPKFDIAGRSGWDSIASAKKINAKTVKFVFKKPYAPWKVMLTQSVFPAHALRGEDFNSVWNNSLNNPKTGVSMANGPFKLHGYTKGQSIVMVRNSTFWGKRPSLDRITFVFRTNTDTEIQAIRGGEVDAIYPQPQLQLAQLKGESGLRVQSNAGALSSTSTSTQVRETATRCSASAGSARRSPTQSTGRRWFHSCSGRSTRSCRC
jgi:peptide/nickel transport system substrate-binding protein